MKDRVVVSVSSIHGTKHFHFGKKLRRLLKGVSCSILVGAVIAGTTIYYLKHERDFAVVKQQELQQEQMSLTEEVESLKDLKANLENDLVEREEKFNLVSDRLGDLEKVLGVGESEGELDTRLDTAAITSSVRVVMLTQIPSGAPVHNARLSSGYGKRKHPVTGFIKFHRGLDFAVNTGTPIYAPADGVVEVIRPSKKGSGNFLQLQHSYGFTTSYSHLNKFAVKRGEFVQKGDLIAYSGNSGLSSGPHLHYEVRFVGRALDPRAFVDWGVDNFDTIFTKIRGIQWDSLVNKVEQRVSTQLQLSSHKAAKSPDS
ncbi:M23 family metallopeptidase [Vibrio sonorensis]|uniref:M23 family metallopeptidase n=1 Tax=Vibrio sonorensis TaxID=1004316 RepID=UPI0008DA0BC2|nr:M23 family metallopeptidase [Vibrio sonorensis]